MSQQRRDLFRKSNALDKLALIQTLLDSRILNSDAAFALLGAVHAELRQRTGNEPRAYVRYGDVIGSIHRQTPQIYREVIAKWEASRLGIPRGATNEYTQEPADDEFESNAKDFKVSYSTVTLRNVEKAAKISVEEKTAEIGGGTEAELEIPEAEDEEEGEAAEERQTAEENEGEEERADLEEEDETEKEEHEESELEENEEEEEQEETEENDSSEEESEEREEEAENEEAEESNEVEKEERETETGEVEEKEEEQEIEKQEVETEIGTENAEEVDQRATEAAEAAGHMEEQEAETTPVDEEEAETEEEPPMGAGE